MKKVLEIIFVLSENDCSEDNGDEELHLVYRAESGPLRKKYDVLGTGVN